MQTLATVLIGFIILSGTSAAGAVPSQPQGDDRLWVFVAAGEPEAPFVDPDLLESAQQVSRELGKKKGLGVPRKAGEADVQIRILRRLRRPSGYSGVVATSPTTAFALPFDEYALVASLVVGDYAQERTGAHTGSWRGAAGKLADQIERWVRQNREQLLARRGKQ